MPVWAQIIIGISAVVIALGVIWTRVLKPGAKLVTTTDEMLPLLRDLSNAFRNTPHAFEVLDEIVSQFRTDSGSSLRDVVNRLDVAAGENKSAAEVLKVGVETVRQLAQQDREQLMRLIVLLDRLTIRVDDVTKTGHRIELQAEHVAGDLAGAHRRANEVVGAPGAAADAAAQHTPKDEAK